MTPAERATKALGGDWHRSYGLCPGPGHSLLDRSMKLIDGDAGQIVVTSFAGDDWRTCRDYLKQRGLIDGEPVQRTYRSPFRRKPSPRSEPQTCEAAAFIWRNAEAGIGTPAETYLRARGITLDVPPSLRFAPFLKHGPTGLTFPAMVAGVQAPDRRLCAVHRTFLKPDGRGKAVVSTPKMALGPIGAGAVRLAAAGDELGLTEGIESGLSAMQIFGVPVWSAIGSRMHAVELPHHVRTVHVFGDNGAPGRAAAEKAAERFTAEGRSVLLRFPPEEHGDWNDALRGSVREAA